MPRPKLKGDKLLAKASGAELQQSVALEVEIVPDIPQISSVEEGHAYLQEFHNKVIGEFQLAYRRSLPWARLAGEVLIQVKELLPHGEFLPWLKANSEISPRQCQSYMAIARGWESVLMANTNSTSYLPSDRELTIAQAAAVVVDWERQQKGSQPRKVPQVRWQQRQQKLSRAVAEYLADFYPQTRQEKTLLRQLEQLLETLSKLQR